MWLRLSTMVDGVRDYRDLVASQCLERESSSMSIVGTTSIILSLKMELTYSIRLSRGDTSSKQNDTNGFTGSFR